MVDSIRQFAARWVAATGRSRLMKLPKVYPILDAESLARRGVALETAAAAFLEGGAGVLQIRKKGHWGREFFAAAQQVARLCREAGVPLIVDDRADFALLLDAGLHLGQDDLAPRDARRLLGLDAAIGFSSHNAAQLAAAGGEPVDYVALGPVFATDSKRNPDPVVGVDEIGRCRLLVEKPLVAIGGITLRNAGEVWKAGADSVAVIGGLLPERATAQSLRQRMEEWQRLQKEARPVRP
jgi:thiamine-phosphate pyrophosphorylase